MLSDWTTLISTVKKHSASPCHYWGTTCHRIQVMLKNQLLGNTTPRFHTNTYGTNYITSHMTLNTLRTGDADLRLYAYKQFKYPVPNVLRSTSSFHLHHYKILEKGAREVSMKNVGWYYTFPPWQNHNPPPKKTHIKQLRTQMSALLWISNSHSTIYIVLITCYHNYEMWH
jgi:hypothetical protein